VERFHVHIALVYLKAWKDEQLINEHIIQMKWQRLQSDFTQADIFFVSINQFHNYLDEWDEHDWRIHKEVRLIGIKLRYVL